MIAPAVTNSPRSMSLPNANIATPAVIAKAYSGPNDELTSAKATSPNTAVMTMDWASFIISPRIYPVSGVLCVNTPNLPWTLRLDRCFRSVRGIFLVSKTRSYTESATTPPAALACVSVDFIGRDTLGASVTQHLDISVASSDSATVALTRQAGNSLSVRAPHLPGYCGQSVAVASKKSPLAAPTVQDAGQGSISPSVERTHDAPEPTNPPMASRWPLRTPIYVQSPLSLPKGTSSNVSMQTPMSKLALIEQLA